MKHLFAGFMLFAMSFIHGLFAQTTNTPTMEKALLWEISGNGIEKPSYIFGTYHMMCKNDFTLDESISSALAKTDKVYLEIDFSNPNEIQNFQKMMMAEKTISEQLSAEKLEKFKSGLKDYGYDLESLNQLSPMVLYSMLMQKFFDCQPNELQMLDMQIMQMAMANGKAMGGLETAEQQMEIFAKYVTIDELYNMVTAFEKNKKLTQDMLKAYVTQDLNNLYVHFGDIGEITKEQVEIFLDKRNENWVKAMPQIIKSQPTFFAVGAGHLPGDKGVINLLREQGYTVKPITK
ncbi:MAG: TraB/GumN family protein [Cruoricaptor ignavus]|nr:TraB/GumN family protein [Cruoricaptor ignavus]